MAGNLGEFALLTNAEPRPADYTTATSLASLRTLDVWRTGRRALTSRRLSGLSARVYIYSNKSYGTPPCGCSSQLPKPKSEFEFAPSSPVSLADREPGLGHRFTERPQ